MESLLASESSTTESLASLFRKLPLTERQARLAALTEREREVLPYTWRFWARPKQLPPPGDWRFWFLRCGRGFGKTRTGAEWTRDQVENGKKGRLALISSTAGDARDVMVEGESGILATAPPWFRPEYEPSKRRLTWPNGAIASLYSGEEPERLRGPQHDGGWLDELPAWKYPRDTWNNFLFGLRLGENPQAVITATLKPISLVSEILSKPGCVAVQGSSYENRENLADAFFEEIVASYEGTRLGRQELYGDLLEDVPGALWTRKLIDAARLPSVKVDLVRIVVAADPAVTNTDDSDSTGISVAAKGDDGDFYVLADRTCRKSPDGWATAIVEAFDYFGADRVVGETNNGGDLVETVIRTKRRDIPYTKVTASRGKAVRAEPVAALYEQGRVHHIGYFEALEDQMVRMRSDGYTGKGSPDNLDALVWGITELMEGAAPALLSSEVHNVGETVVDSLTSDSIEDDGPGRSTFII